MAETINEKKQPEWKIIFRFIIIPIALFLLFKKLFFELFTSTFVKFIFSKVGEASYSKDIAAIIICAIAITFFAPKIFKGAVIPKKWWYLTITYILVYFYFRFQIKIEKFLEIGLESHLEFTAFKTKILSSFALLDLTIALPLFILLVITSKIIYGKLKPKAEVKSFKTIGFTVEEPEVNTTDDLLGRNKFIKNLAEQIRNTKTENGSFPIGISASWGSGKTTFLKSLLNQFKDDKNFVIIELNVWKAGIPNLIIETLFKELREKLKDYSFTLNNKLPEYASNLTKVSKEGFETFKTLSELAFPTESLEKQFKTIGEAIKATKKKIIISIDDLDRLDKKEVYEVIRLIRNTANFANTFFIVAYDRNYILSAIEEINPYKAHIFLEKIFQLEFSLPPTKASIIQSQIREGLQNFLEDIDLKSLDEMINKNSKDDDRTRINLTSLLIHNIRDVIRFINSLKSNYTDLSKDVCFPDLYNLEVIRFKHPEISSEFYRRHPEFISNYYISDYEKEWNATITPKSNETVKTKAVHLEMVENETTKKNLRTFLKNEEKIYKISDQEIGELVNAFDSLFPKTESNIKVLDSDTTKNSLSVIYPSKLDRYFTKSMEGRLSGLKFSQIRDLPLKESNEEISKLCSNREMIDEISEKLEYLREFDNKEDFEKMIKIIFHFANLQNTKMENESDPNKKYIGFRNIVIEKYFDKSFTNKFYETKESYKEFLKSLIEDSNGFMTNAFISGKLLQLNTL